VIGGKEKKKTTCLLHISMFMKVRYVDPVRSAKFDRIEWTYSFNLKTMMFFFD
jgi:hypothetical protein